MTTPIVKIKGIGLHSAEILAENGFKSAEDLAATTEDALGKIPGFGPARAKMVIKAARALCKAGSENEVPPSSMAVVAETTEDILVDDDIKAAETEDIRRLEKKGKLKKKGKKKKKKKEDKEAGKEKKQKKTKKVKKTSTKKKKKKKKKKSDFS